MPSDSTLRSFLAELSPEDVATLVGRFSRLLPQGAAVYSPELNAGEAEWIAEQRMKRGLAQERERAILEQLLPQAMARQRAMIPESQADVFVPTRPRIMRESPFIATQPRPMPDAGIMGRKREYAEGGPVLPDQTQPDITDAGRVLADLSPYAGGGKVEALKLLKGDLFHGGSYKKGDTITQPLYTTPSREMAETYVDEYRNPGSSLKQLRPNVKNPAPERLVNAASRRYVPENERMGYTPASAFDQNLHDPRAIARMIAELRRRGYDSAVATDIGMSGPGAVEAPALIAFPGAKAYAKGGKVATKTLDEMQAELIGKQGLTRRSLFGLPTQSQQYPLSKVEQEVQRIEQQARKKGEAPSVTSTRVDVDPGTGSKRSVMESIAETPVSRRMILKTAGSQAMQGMLPMGDIAKALDVPVSTGVAGALSRATQAAPVIPVVTEAMIPGMIAEGLKMGYSFPRIMRMIESDLGTGLKNVGADDIERAYYNMFDPFSATSGFERKVTPGEAWQSLTGVERAYGSPMGKMRQSMRSVKAADPELYNTLKTLSRDIAEYGLE